MVFSKFSDRLPTVSLRCFSMLTLLVMLFVFLQGGTVQGAQISTGSMRTMHVREDAADSTVLPEAQEAIPNTAGTVSEEETAVTTTGTTDDTVASTDQSTQGNTVAAVEENATEETTITDSDGNGIVETDATAPADANATETSSDADPTASGQEVNNMGTADTDTTQVNNTKEGLEADNNTTPSTDQTAEQTNQTTSEASQTTPDTNQTASDTNQTTPEASQTTPDTNQTASDTNQTTLEANQTTPEASQSTPDTNQTTPDTNLTTPDTNQTIPEISQTTPEEKPEADQTAPDTNQTTPETNQTVPDSTGSENTKCSSKEGYSTHTLNINEIPAEIRPYVVNISFVQTEIVPLKVLTNHVAEAVLRALNLNLLSSFDDVYAPLVFTTADVHFVNIKRHAQYDYKKYNCSYLHHQKAHLESTNSVLPGTTFSLMMTNRSDIMHGKMTFISSTELTSIFKTFMEQLDTTGGDQYFNGATFMKDLYCLSPTFPSAAKAVNEDDSGDVGTDDNTSSGSDGVGSPYVFLMVVAGLAIIALTVWFARSYYLKRKSGGSYSLHDDTNALGVPGDQSYKGRTSTNFSNSTGERYDMVNII
eukprot:Nk52_evm12s2133 gene=Nk52_evmTU12s2133